MPDLLSSNEIIEDQLAQRLKAVENVLDADVLTYSGPISDDIQPLVKEILESITDRRTRLAVVLETGGGYIESAERLVNTIRHHYEIVDFIVVSYAMSAGTVLVMSGDSIYMDYAATLGPIDPQLEQPGSGTNIPALGYLEQFDRLVAKSRDGTLTTAELAYMIERFDPAEMYKYEQARDLSIALLEEWLATYKFKNWIKTATRHRTVTAAMKKKRAAEIATILSDTRRWRSHSRGISMYVLQRDLNLQIEDIEANPRLRETLANYYDLLWDYRHKRRHELFVLNWAGGYHGH
jgi:membrane-bound ClpP family serine protease